MFSYMYNSWCSLFLNVTQISIWDHFFFFFLALRTLNNDVLQQKSIINKICNILHFWKCIFTFRYRILRILGSERFLFVCFSCKL